MEALHKVKGGAQLGWWYRPWPFSSIEVFSDKIILKAPPKTVELKISDLKAVARWYLWGTLFEHKNQSLPEFLVFYSTRIKKSKELRAMIENLIKQQTSL